MDYRAICQSLINRVRIQQQDYEYLEDINRHMESKLRRSPEQEHEDALNDRDQWHEKYLDLLRQYEDAHKESPRDNKQPDEGSGQPY